MSDVKVEDIYPLTVEEYETAEVVAADVEVEQFFYLTKLGVWLIPDPFFLFNTISSVISMQR